MTLKISVSISILISILFISVCSQTIHDFSYSNYSIQQLERKEKKVRILSPPNSVFDRFKFPQACDYYLINDICEDKDYTPASVQGIDQAIRFFKENVAEFLMLSNKVQLLVKNLKELPQIKNDVNLLIKQEQFAVIDQHQKRLNSTKQLINGKGSQLSILILQIMKYQQNPLFKQAALSFQKKALTQKITLFSYLYQQANIASAEQSRQKNQKKFSEFYTKIQEIYENQTVLLSKIDQILNQINQISQIKSRIQSLQSQIKAWNSNIFQKQACKKQYQQIKAKYKGDEDMFNHIQKKIRQNKKQNVDLSKVCEGAQQKLQQRIKSFWKTQNFRIKCFEDLQDLTETRNGLLNQWQRAKDKLQKIDVSKEFQQYKYQYAKYRKQTQNAIEQVKTLKLDRGYADTGLLLRFISDSQNRIKQIQQEQTSLLGLVPSDVSQIQGKVQVIIEAIKELKGRYCEQNQFYISQAKILQDRLYKLQEQEVHNGWIHKVQIQKLEEIEEIKRRMKEIEDDILTRMQIQEL